MTAWRTVFRAACLYAVLECLLIAWVIPALLEV